MRYGSIVEFGRLSDAKNKSNRVYKGYPLENIKKGPSNYYLTHNYALQVEIFK